MKYKIKMLNYLEATVLGQNATSGKHFKFALQDSYLKAYTRLVLMTRCTFHYFLMVARAPVTRHTCTTSVYVLCVLCLHSFR